MVDHQHAWKRAGAQWSRGVGIDDLSFVTMDAYGFRDHAFVNHGKLLPQSDFVCSQKCGAAPPVTSELSRSAPTCECSQAYFSVVGVVAIARKLAGIMVRMWIDGATDDKESRVREAAGDAIALIEKTR